MKKLAVLFLAQVMMFSGLFAQEGADYYLKELKLKPSDKLYSSPVQLKKRKAVSAYVGAGYSFVIFTSDYMNTSYPVFDTRNGDFLSLINIFLGFSIAEAVTLEFEPSILFTNNDRQVLHFRFTPSITIGGSTYTYAHPQTMSMLAFPLAVNARFFPFYKTSKGFGKLFFIGGGLGGVWIREEYDNFYNNNPLGPVYGELNTAYITESTSQWQPIFRIMTGFTGAGGQFGFGGEVRYNIIPLKQTSEPFATRTAGNFNSVDLTLRFYFGI